MFSTRIPSTLEPTELAAAADALRAAGVEFADLTASDPTRLGFDYPPDMLLPLADPRGLEYTPAPLGIPAAREAVRADYARRGVDVAASRIAITASTSESYSFLFKLLCEPGDVVLVPEPSYPLFGYLTALDAIEARPYRLAYDGGWRFDPQALDGLVDERTRAIVVVTPNNPTGTRLRRDELAALAERCARQGLALIGDEVFADYTLEPASDTAASVLEPSAALTFSLGGASKTIGLPQVKLGWMAVGGSEPLVAEALARLDVIADAYLSVGTPVQVAAARLLQDGAFVRRQIADRVLLNYRSLKAAAAEHPACRVPPVDGGWSAVIQAPAVMPDEARARELLEDHHVLVHPGCLFDFPRPGHFVVSLLPRPEVFAPAVRRLLAALSA